MFAVRGFCATPAFALTGESSGTIIGTVTDPTGAVLPGATVTIQNPVSQYERTAHDGQCWGTSRSPTCRTTRTT